ncbi:DUF411 domain-containing protein [Devosia sp.]|uniref:DUF411 domain-containing protein n=1 Tax=Devosia sp. TaxID=1871048 RepID=UPI0019FFA202|nr:DUF411 domain-containing protein [Devosia sp.]MBE0580236.1 DUF411 domain-containing protein [Devosia sp.]
MHTRRTVLIAALNLTGGALIGPAFAQTALPNITIRKDPWCGCCSGWARHLEMAGFTIEIEEIEEMEAVKDTLMVPDALRSCHTATVDDYVIEGHVPAEALVALLEQRPPITGLAVPGMPMGSPGMEGPPGSSPETFDVVAFGGQSDAVFMRFAGQTRL